MEGPRRRSADNLLSSAGWREAAGGGRGKQSLRHLESSRSSFSFLISWALSLQTVVGGRERGLRRGGGRDDCEFGGLGNAIRTSRLQRQTRAPSASCPPSHPADAAANFIRPQPWPALIGCGFISSSCSAAPSRGPLTTRLGRRYRQAEAQNDTSQLCFALSPGSKVKLGGSSVLRRIARWLHQETESEVSLTQTL